MSGIAGMHPAVITDTQDLIRLAEQDPRGCIDLCRRIIDEAVSTRRVAEAHRAIGIAYRDLGQIEDSIQQLKVARDRFSGLGDTVEEAESAITLAASVAMSGGLGEAIESLESLMDHQEALVRAHAKVQKAGLIARTGDLGGAIVLYEQAQPVLERLVDRRWLALLHSTRGLVRTYLSDFDEAETDFKTARQLFLDLSRPSKSAAMLHNLGFLAVQRGDIARGIALLGEAEDEYQQTGRAIEVIRSDRAHAYMLAGLPGEAFKVASTVADRLGAAARALDQAEALYIAARAALADGSFEKAASLAAETAELAALQDRALWRLLAEVIAEEARWRAGNPGDPATLLELARAFDGHGNPSGRVHALALAAMRELERDDPRAARAHLDMVDSEANLELPVRLLAATAKARVALAMGESQEALEILRAAADVVDGHRLLLAATEARAGVSRLADEIAALGLEALGRGNSSLIHWTERFRGASLRIAPVVRSRDDELVGPLAELRGAVRDLENMRLQGEDTREQSGQVQQLEARIRDLALAREQREASPSAVLPLSEVAAALGSRRMLYIYNMGGRTLGQIVGEEAGFELGERDRIRTLANHMGATLRREFMITSRSQPQRVHDMIGELGAQLLGPVAVEGVEAVVVVPPPDLLSLPWNAMAAAVNRDLELVVSPSAGMWLQASRVDRKAEGVSIVAGPRLEFAPIEANLLAGLYQAEAELLAGDRATVQAVMEAVARCGVFHGVTHTRLRHDNPMFSALELADGFLSLYDLESVSVIPDTVVLSACESAHGNVVGGHEMYGLTSILLSHGARSIIATVGPIPDSHDSVESAVRIHSALRDGASGPAALRQAQAAARDGGVDPSIAFVAYGAA